MSKYAKPLEKLIAEISNLPGIGTKSAQRLAFHILNMEDKEVVQLVNTIVNAKRTMHKCSVCGNLTDTNPCSICSDTRRSDNIICVVEEPKDVAALEKTKEFHGKYHVLNGLISPMDGVGADDINLKSLITRIQANPQVEEIIIATNPNVEGEATAMYIARLIKPSGIKVTRIAHGIPVGGDLEYTDEITLLKAMEGRQEL
ncbi:MAG: recombination mediator RecR [Clostridia bacterium]|nr:recombination mediator RecR [Clostridia bacterium]